METNNEDCCRVCVGKRNLISVFSTHQGTMLADKIMYCASVQISEDDLLPSNICKQCLFYLDNAYIFKTVCEWTDAKLRQKLQNNFQQKINTYETVVENEIDLEECGTFNISQYSQHINNVKCHISKAQQDSKILTEKKNFLVIHMKDVGEHLNDTASSTIDDNHADTNFVSCDDENLINMDDYIVINNQGLPILPCLEGISETTCVKHHEILCKNNDKQININTDDCKLNENEEIMEFSSTSENLHFESMKLNNVDCVQNLLCETNTALNHTGALFGKKMGVLLTPTNFEETEMTKKNVIVSNTVSKGKGTLNLSVDEDINVGCEEVISSNEDMFTGNGIVFTLMNKKENMIEKVIVEEVFTENEPFISGKFFNKTILAQNKPYLFENDNNTEDSFDNKNDSENACNNTLVSFQDELPAANGNLKMEELTKEPIFEDTKKEERVGRHIAKKNASQPPKRYSPDVYIIKRGTEEEQTKKSSSYYQNTPDTVTQKVLNDPSIFEKEKKIETDELKHEDDILTNNHIFEHELSMPDPIFEETIITENFEYQEGHNVLDAMAPNSTKLLLDIVEPNINKPVKGENNRNRNKNKTSLKQVKQKQNKRSQKRKKKMRFDSKLPMKRQLRKPLKITRENKKIYVFIDQKAHKSSSYKKSVVVKKKSDAKLINKLKMIEASESGSNSSDLDDLKNLKSSLNKNEKHYDFSCDMCDKSFPFHSHLVRHITTHSGLKQYTCDVCKKQFINKYNLTVHKRKHSGKFPLQCDTCGSGFSSPSILKRHARSHSGETPFHCKFCLKQFAHSSSLHMHEKMHVHRPTYTCDICSKVFSYTNSLLAHKRTHSGYKAFTCDVCHKSFTRNTSLVRHMCCHTEEKKLKCRVCNEIFINSNDYAVHLKVHSKYKCEHCDDVFLTKTLLLRHEKKHRVYFKCEQCFRKFVNKSLLIRHLQKHVRSEK